LLDLLKNCVGEVIASEVNDFNILPYLSTQFNLHTKLCTRLLDYFILNTLFSQTEHLRSLI
jgi:hypothetical protein